MRSILSGLKIDEVEIGDKVTIPKLYQKQMPTCLLL
jgi:hypothetical protein